MTGILLEADGVEALDVGPGSGYIVRRLDLGDAAIREVVDNAPDADGTDDSTTFAGSSVVTLAVRIVPRNGFVPAVLEQRLRSFTAPHLRPIMTVTRDGLQPQRLVLRRGPWQSPIERPMFEDITVQWIAPLGILESAEEHVVTIYAAGAGAVVGRTYPLTYPRVYPASPPLGIGSVVNAGNRYAFPLIRFYGPLTDPVLDNLTQNKSLAFTGLTLAAGEFLEVNIRAKTVLFNGEPANNRYSNLVFPASRWWTLSPGLNQFRFHPATFTEGVSNAELTWRDASA